jgi:hypothetical protein
MTEVAPPPPPGPGVQPPFVAPPTDGARERRWLAVALAIGATLIVCIGGLAGLGGLVVFGNQMIKDEAHAAVSNYLGALRDSDWPKAWDLLCAERQAGTSKDQFARTQAAKPHVSAFTVGELSLANGIEVPATITYTDRSVVTVTYVLEQDRKTGALKVCGTGG